MSTDVSTALNAKKLKKRKREEDRANHKAHRKEDQREERDVTKDESAKPMKKKQKVQQEAVFDVAVNAVPLKVKNKKHKKDKNETQAVDSKSIDESEKRLETQSPFVTQTTSFYLTLSPCAYTFPLEGLCAEHISPLLLTYYSPLSGVVLSYSNPSLSEHPNAALQSRSNSNVEGILGRSIDEYAVTYIWLTAEFLLFKPTRGCWLEGHVISQNEGMIGLMCYNYFSAAIEVANLPGDWTWKNESSERTSTKSQTRQRDSESGTGHFVDGDGRKIEGRIVFQVLDFDADPGAEGSGGTISIQGTLRRERDPR